MKIIEFTPLEKKCLQCLNNCTQSLIWFNSKVTPWFYILNKDRDHLNAFALKCKKAGILKDLTGYSTHSEMTFDSASIVNFQKPGQLTLF